MQPQNLMFWHIDEADVHGDLPSSQMNVIKIREPRLDWKYGWVSSWMLIDVVLNRNAKHWYSKRRDLSNFCKLGKRPEPNSSKFWVIKNWHLELFFRFNKDPLTS